MKQAEQLEVDRLAALESGKLISVPLLIMILFTNLRNGIFITEKQAAQRAKSTQPSGHGDTFTPGEWNPSSSKR